MVSGETRSRLRWHAGLEDIGETSIPSISSCTWPPDHLGAQLEGAVADFIATLGTLNRELNGEIPSESTSSDDVVPTDVAYAVAEVTRMLRDYADAETSSARAPGLKEAWLIETAWLAVLAGDIDDLQQHLNEEEATRTPR
jgi:hypothetical protein